MYRRSFTILFLVVVATVAATSLDAEAGTKRPHAKIVSAERATGHSVTVTLLVRDRESRDLPLSLEFTAKGVKGWHPATIEPGPDLEAVSSSPEGETFVLTWHAGADLPSKKRWKARLRTLVEVEKGKKRKSKRILIDLLYENVTHDALSAVLHPDLMDDGEVQSLVLIDTRNPADFAAGTIPGAISLSADDIEEGGETVLDYPKDTLLVFFCYGGL